MAKTYTISEYADDNGETMYTGLYCGQAVIKEQPDEKAVSEYMRAIYHAAHGQRELRYWNGKTGKLTVLETATN